MYMASKLHSSDFRIALLYTCWILLGSWVHVDAQIVFTQEPEDVFGVKDNDVYLSCTAVSTSQAAVNITWWQDGNLVNDARRYVLPDGRLKISGLIHKPNKLRSDEGVFNCVANDTFGAVTSRSARLHVAYLNRVSGNPQNEAVARGDIARFSCNIQGAPSPVISWEKDKQPLPQLNNQKYTVFTSGVLQIQNVTAADAGLYRCKASNILPRVRHSKPAHLTVLPQSSENTGPSLVAGPEDTAALQGEDVVLECAIRSLPHHTPHLPRTYWSRADHSALPEGRSALVGRSNLRLTSVQLRDAGQYICHYGTVRASATLQVNTLPHVHMPESVIDKPMGLSLRITCDANGGFPPPTLSWYRNGHVLSDGLRISIKDDGRNLTVANTRLTDSGYYQCVASNAAGRASQSVKVTVELQDEAPAAPTGVHAEVRGSRTIAIRWNPSPPVNNKPTMAYSIHYYPASAANAKEAQQVEMNTSCILTDLQPYTDYAIYITAYNKQGVSPTSQTVRVRTSAGVPLRAPDVEVVAVGASSLRVVWSRLSTVSAQGNVTGYRLYYRRHSEPDSTERLIKLPAASHSYTITDLEPDQTYDVRVLAGTEAGYPDLGEQDWPWVSHMTNSGGTPTIPGVDDFTASPVNATTLHVSWQPVVVGEHAAPLIGYRLRFQKVSEANEKEVILTDADTFHTLYGLEPATSYRLTVLGFSADGSGEATSVSTTMPSLGGNRYSPPPPADVEVEACNDTAIHIRWKPPALFTGHITGYTLRYSPVSQMSEGPVTELNTTLSEMTVGDLVPYTFYEFAVRSNTAQHVGSYSVYINCRTQEGMPSAPLNPQWSLHGPRSVELHWQPPAHKNGVIVAYHILFRENFDSLADGWQSKHENGTVTKAVVANLESNAIYLFKVKAVTGRGEGPPTHVITIHTQGHPTPNPSMTTGQQKSLEDKELGIIVGVCIGVGCIIICAIILLLRNRCMPSPHPYPPPCQHTTHAMQCSCGHQQSPAMMVSLHRPYYHPDLTDRHYPANRLPDTETFMPMLTHIPENEHSDTKGLGGSLGLGGRVNGSCAVNGIKASHMLNGRAKAYLLHTNKNSPEDDSSQVPLQAHMMGIGSDGQNVSTCSGYSSAGPAACSLEDLEQCVVRDSSRLDEAGGDSSIEGEDSGHCCADHASTSTSHCCSSAQSSLGRQCSVIHDVSAPLMSATLGVNGTQPTPLPSKHPTQCQSPPPHQSHHPQPPQQQQHLSSRPRHGDASGWRPNTAAIDTCGSGEEMVLVHQAGSPLKYTSSSPTTAASTSSL